MSSQVQTEMQSRMEMAKSMKNEEKIYKYKGVLYPTIMSPPENLAALQSLEARPDDIMLVAYPKCGFNWIVAVLQRIKDAAIGEQKDEPKLIRLIEFLNPDLQKVLSQAPSPRLVGTHLHPDYIPTSFTEKKTKMLVVLRNPKDTAVSFYHFSCKNPVLKVPDSWDQFYTEFITGEVPWGSYFDHILAWEKRLDDPNVMVVTFEELKENLSGSIQQISTFFGLSLNEEQVQTITQESTFTAMKEKSKDSHGSMGHVFFRKGEVGDWKTLFTESQNEQMDAEFTKHLAGTKLGARLKYDIHCK